MDAPRSGGLHQGAPVSRISRPRAAPASGVLQALWGSAGMLQDDPGPMRFQVSLLAPGELEHGWTAGLNLPILGQGEAAQDELPGSRGVVVLPWKWGILSSNCKAKLV